MKSIFQKEVYKKEYSVSKKGRYIASINDFISEMKYNYNRSPYYIYPTKKLIDKITFYETDNFNKEFVKDDKVCINNNIYIIKDYIYDEKAITYIVYENEIIDDEESKQVTIKERFGNLNILINT